MDYSSGAVTVGVHVERIRVARPADAARTAGAVALAHCGLARTTLLLIVGCGKQPGMGVAPWTIDGTLDAANTLGLRVRCDRIGHAAPHDAVHRRLAQRELAPPPPGPPLGLHVPGARRPVAVPAHWVGAHACVLVPCVRRLPADPSASSSAHSTQGPATIALSTLAEQCTAEPLSDAVSVGAWLAAHVFASASVVVDASWDATFDAEGARLVASERLLASGRLDAAAIDTAVARHIPQAAARPRAALARRRVTGLGHRSASKHQASAVRVPGSLALAWNAYPDPRAETSR